MSLATPVWSASVTETRSVCSPCDASNSVGVTEKATTVGASTSASTASLTNWTVAAPRSLARSSGYSTVPLPIWSLATSSTPQAPLRLPLGIVAAPEYTACWSSPETRRSVKWSWGLLVLSGQVCA